MSGVITSRIFIEPLLAAPNRVNPALHMGGHAVE